MPLTQKQDTMLNRIGWIRAGLLLLLMLLMLLSLQSCATNYRGDYRFGRQSSGVESQRADYSVSGTVRQSEPKDVSAERQSYKQLLSGLNSSNSDADRPSSSPVVSDSKASTGRTIGDLFDGPLVGFVAGNMLLRWSHPFIWMSAMAIAVLIESEAMEYFRQTFFSP